MNEITIGQIAAAVAMIAALISGLAIIGQRLKSYIKSAFGDSAKEITAQIEALDKKIKQLEKRVEKVDQEAVKNYLVPFLAGVERGNPVDEIERERFHEEYQHYVDGGGNSYIKSKVDKLKKEGKL